MQGSFRSKKNEKIIRIYKELREKADELFQSVYTKTVRLTNEFGTEEKWSQLCGQQIN